MLADDQLITLTVGQFRDAVAYAVKEALQPLQARVSVVEDKYVHLTEESAALAATQAHLAENQEIQLRLINELRKKPQPIQKDRARSSELSLWPMAARCWRRTPGRGCTFPRNGSLNC